MEVGDDVRRVCGGRNGHMSVGSVGVIRRIKYISDGARGFLLEHGGNTWHDESAYELVGAKQEGFGKLNNFRFVK